jgi:hypothetical protein
MLGPSWSAKRTKWLVEKFVHILPALRRGLLDKKKSNSFLQPDTLSAAREIQQGNESTINQRKQEMIWGQRKEYQWTDRTHQDLYQRETHPNSQFEQKNEHLGKWLCE